MLAPNKYKQKIINGIVVVLLLSIVMSWSTNNPQRLHVFKNVVAQCLYPFQYAASAVTSFAVNSWQFVADIRSVYTENQELKELVDMYAGIELQLIEVRQENFRLRALLNFKDDIDYTYTPGFPPFQLTRVPKTGSKWTCLLSQIRAWWGKSSRFIQPIPKFSY